MFNELLKNKVSEMISEKLESAVKDKLMKKGVVKFSWAFDVTPEGKLFITKIVRQFQDGKVESEDCRISISEYLSDGISKA